MTDLAAATKAYQTYLEGVRAHPEDRELQEDLSRALDELETAWLNATYTRDQPIA